MGKKLFERVVESPSVVLEKTIDTSQHLVDSVTHQKHLQRAGAYWRALGPGLTTGASDDDPSGIATYSQTGAQYGFQLLWLSGFTFPLMSAVQEMCARIGLVTGRGLAANIRLHFPRWVLYSCTVLLFLANTFNIGANLGAMAKATQLLAPSISFGTLVMGYAFLSLGLQIFSAYDKYARYLKWLALILLAYIFSALSISSISWGEVIRSAVTPSLSLNQEQILLVAAILGTTISPYLFFWQTSQEVEEQILEGKTNLQLRKGTTPEAVKRMRIDVWSGMFLSNVVMFFIIATCAAALNANGITTISTAAEAAEALRPFAGDQAYLLFALGIIGTGMLAIPVLAGSSSYAMAESFGWREGLYRKLKEARSFYGVIILSTLVGLGLNFSGIDPIKALIYSAVANGLVAPVVLVLIVLLSSNKKVMGEHVNHKATTTLGWIITILMMLAGAAAVYSMAA